MNKQDTLELALASRDIRISVAYGSAGTGKTYTSLKAALAFLGDFNNPHTKNKKSIVLLRPPVSFTKEAAALPGNEQEKLDPWKRPIKQNLAELGVTYKQQEFMEKSGIIQYYPLEYVQGMTFHDSFIIIDEAENLSFKQLRTVTTRIGRWSKMVLCGDVAQTSEYFPNSGLGEFINMVHILNLPINTVGFTSEDCVRGPECKMMIEAFESWDERGAGF